MDLSGFQKYSAHVQGNYSYEVFRDKKATEVCVLKVHGSEEAVFVIKKGIAYTKPVSILGSTTKRTVSFYQKMFSNVEIDKIMFSDENNIYSVPYDVFMKAHFITKAEGFLKKVFLSLSDVKNYIL